jgi:hypothetical protein
LLRASRRRLLHAHNAAIHIAASGRRSIHHQPLFTPLNSLRREVTESVLLQTAEAIRSYAAVRVRLAKSADEATQLRPYTLKPALVAKLSGC